MNISLAMRAEIKMNLIVFFCFCTLYNKENCGGAFAYLGNGIKDCSSHNFPHIAENYGFIIDAIKNI